MMGRRKAAVLPDPVCALEEEGMVVCKSIFRVTI